MVGDEWHPSRVIDKTSALDALLSDWDFLSTATKEVAHGWDKGLW